MSLPVLRPIHSSINLERFLLYIFMRLFLCCTLNTIDASQMTNYVKAFILKGQYAKECFDVFQCVT